MLAKSQGHSVMKQKIDQQKMVTRDALSFVAEISRTRSIFYTPRNTQSQFDSVSQVGADDLNTSQMEEEKTQLREERLMKLLNKSEIKK